MRAPAAAAALVVAWAAGARGFYTTPTYLGCWTDTAQDRDLDGDIVFAMGQYASPGLCAEYCWVGSKSGPYPFFGLQDGDFCVCGATYGKFGPARLGESQCDKPCVVDPGVMCGGFSFNSVYRIPPDTPRPGTPSPPTAVPTTPAPPTYPPRTPGPPTPAPATRPPPTLPPWRDPAYLASPAYDLWAFERLQRLRESPVYRDSPTYRNSPDAKAAPAYKDSPVYDAGMEGDEPEGLSPTDRSGASEGDTVAPATAPPPTPLPTTAAPPTFAPRVGGTVAPARTEAPPDGYVGGWLGKTPAPPTPAPPTETPMTRTPGTFAPDSYAPRATLAPRGAADGDGGTPVPTPATSAPTAATSTATPTSPAPSTPPPRAPQGGAGRDGGGANATTGAYPTELPIEMAAGVAIVLGAVGMSGAVVPAARAIVLAQDTCGAAAVRGRGAMPEALHPTAVVIDGSEPLGAAAVDTGVLLVAVGVAALFSRWRGRHPEGTHASCTRALDAYGFLRWPSLPLAVLACLHPSAFYAFARLLAEPGGRVLHGAAGFTGVAALTAAPLCLLRGLARGVGVRALYRRAPPDGRGGACAAPTVCGRGEWVSAVTTPPGVRPAGDTGYVERWHAALCGAAQKFPLMLPLELVAAGAVSGGHALDTETWAQCAHVKVAAAAVLAGLLVVEAATASPRATPLQAATFPVSLALQVAAMGLLAVGYHHASYTHVAFGLAHKLLFLAVALLLLQAAADCLALLASAHAGRRALRQHEEHLRPTHALCVGVCDADHGTEVTLVEVATDVNDAGDGAAAAAVAAVPAPHSDIVSSRSAGVFTRGTGSGAAPWGTWYGARGSVVAPVPTHTHSSRRSDTWQAPHPPAGTAMRTGSLDARTHSALSLTPPHARGGAGSGIGSVGSGVRWRSAVERSPPPPILSMIDGIDEAESESTDRESDGGVSAAARGGSGGIERVGTGSIRSSSSSSSSTSTSRSSDDEGRTSHMQRLLAAGDALPEGTLVVYDDWALAMPGKCASRPSGLPPPTVGVPRVAGDDPEVAPARDGESTAGAAASANRGRQGDQRRALPPKTADGGRGVVGNTCAATAAGPHQMQHEGGPDAAGDGGRRGRDGEPGSILRSVRAKTQSFMQTVARVRGGLGATAATPAGTIVKYPPVPGGAVCTTAVVAVDAAKPTPPASAATTPRVARAGVLRTPQGTSSMPPPPDPRRCASAGVFVGRRAASVRYPPSKGGTPPPPRSLSAGRVRVVTGSGGGRSHGRSPPGVDLDDPRWWAHAAPSIHR